MRPKKILVVAQTPPPIHGQAVMNQFFLDGTYKYIELFHVRMAFSESISEVGSFKIRKVVHLFVLLYKIYIARIRTGAEILYYLPASPNMAPFLRDCFLLILTRWLFKKVVFHFHANGISNFIEHLPKSLQYVSRLAYFSPDLCISLTQYAVDDSLFLHARRIEVIPNGIPDIHPNTGYPSLSNRHPKILFLSTLSIEKGVAVLLEALVILLKKKIDFLCEIVGPFSSQADESSLKEFAKPLLLAQRVVWRGPLSGEAKWHAYAGADIFCFPTHYPAEGLPVVLLEAMMFGLPVVSTNWRGIPDLVCNGTTGYLVPPQNPDLVAEKLKLLILDRDLRHSMGAVARERFKEKFTVEKYQDTMESVLQRV